MGGRGGSSGGARAGAGPGNLPKGGAGSPLRSVAPVLGADFDAVAGRVLGSGAASALRQLTRAPAGYSASIDRLVSDGGAIEVYATVRTAGGAFAGEVGATFRREGGRLVATTDNLLMGAAHQGRGVGAAMARNLDATYRALGVSEVRLSAAQVGRYTWAKAGYEWSPATGRAMAAAYSSWLGRNGHDPAGGAVALRGARAVADSRHGKSFLLSDAAPNWEGTKRL